MRGPIDQAIAALSQRQHGNITREQLLRLGLGPAAIAYRARIGSLHRVHVGVYAVGRPPSTPLERAAAAVLACGSDALLSHESALTLWGLARHWRTPLQVSVPRERRRPGIVVHRVSGLTRPDIRRQLGIPVTSPARTVLDCAPELPDRRLARLINDGRLSRHLRPSALSEVVRRFPRHPGCGHVATAIDGLAPNPTRSDFEDKFRAFCRRFGLPTPAVNVWVCGYEVDAWFEAEGVIVERERANRASAREGRSEPRT